MKKENIVVGQHVASKKDSRVGKIDSIVDDRVEILILGHSYKYSKETLQRWWEESTEEAYIATFPISSINNKEEVTMEDKNNKKAPAPAGVKAPAPNAGAKKADTSANKTVKPENTKKEISAEEKAAQEAAAKAAKEAKKQNKAAEKKAQKEHLKDTVNNRVETLINWAKSKGCTYQEKSFYNPISYNGFGIAFVLIHSNTIELRLHPASLERQPELIKKCHKLPDTYKTHMSMKFNVINDNDLETAKELIKAGMAYRAESKEEIKASKVAEKAQKKAEKKAASNKAKEEKQEAKKAEKEKKDQEPKQTTENSTSPTQA